MPIHSTTIFYPSLFRESLIKLSVGHFAMNNYIRWDGKVKSLGNVVRKYEWIAMNQVSFPEIAFTNKMKQARKGRFFGEMNSVLPWAVA